MSDRHRSVKMTAPFFKQKTLLNKVLFNAQFALSSCYKTDDMLSNFKTLNSNGALRSKHHAVWETISPKEKLPITRKLSNASKGADAALVEVTELIAAVNHDFTSLYMLHYLKNLFSLNYNDFCPLICRGDVD